MQEFIELKQSSEFILFMVGVMIVFGHIGYSYGEFQKSGGTIMDIVKNINYNRAKWVSKKIFQ